MSYVVTAGQLQAVQRTFNYNYNTGQPVGLSLSPNLSLTYEQLWRAQPALRTVTTFLARNVASLSIDPYRRLSATDREKATDHPLSRMLARPGGVRSTWTLYRLLNTLMNDLCIYDNGYWLKVKTADGGRGLQPIPPSMVTPQGTNIFRTEKFRITGSKGYRDVPADQMVHFHGYSPDDQRTGVAPVETLRQILAEEYSASVYREQMWRNGARTAGYLTRPADAPAWSTQARERFRANWQAQYTGDSIATGGTPVLEDGMEFKGSAFTPKDAQYVEARKLTREEVAVAYHVSPVMLGLMDGATFSNVTELHKMLYQDTLAPWLVQISQDIECQILDEIDPTSHDGSVYVEFNLSGKLQGSFEQQAQALQSAVGGPWMTRNEARALGNLRQVDGGDELITPLNVVTGGLASPNDTAPDDPDNGPSNGQPPKHRLAAAGALKSFFDDQSRVVASRLGAGIRDVDALFDAHRWDRKLMDIAPHLSASAIADVNADTRADIVAALKTDTPQQTVADLFTGYRAARADWLAYGWELSQ